MKPLFSIKRYTSVAPPAAPSRLDTGKHLGIVVGAFKGGISRAWWRLDNTASASTNMSRGKNQPYAEWVKEYVKG